MKEPTPTILDDVCSRSTDMVKPDEFRRIVASRYSVKRCVFSPKASLLLGELAFESPDIIVDNRQFAIPPFDNMYVELDYSAMIQDEEYKIASQAVGESVTKALIGYLILGGTDVYVMGSYEDVFGGSHFGIMPVKYTINHTDTPKDFFSSIHPIRPFTADDDFTVLSEFYPNLIPQELMKLLLLTGAVTNHRAVIKNHRSILNTYGVHLNSLAISDDVSSALEFSQGQLFWLLGAILLMHQRPLVNYVDVPATSRIIKGKRKAYASYKIIEIDLGKVKTIRRAFQSTPHGSPIGYEIPNHYRHRHGLEHGCGHEWSSRDEKGHWHCLRCGRLRYMVKEHAAGDSSRGWSHADYAYKYKDRVLPEKYRKR